MPQRARWASDSCPGPQAAERGLLDTWAPAVPPLLARHTWGAAAQDGSSFMEGGLLWQGSEPASPWPGVPRERFVFL